MVVVPWLEQNHAKVNSSPSWFTTACPSLPWLFLHQLLLTEAIDKTSVFLPHTDSSLVKWFHVACIRLTFQLPYTGAWLVRSVVTNITKNVTVYVYVFETFGFWENRNMLNGYSTCFGMYHTHHTHTHTHTHTPPPHPHTHHHTHTHTPTHPHTHTPTHPHTHPHTHRSQNIQIEHLNIQGPRSWILKYFISRCWRRKRSNILV